MLDKDKDSSYFCLRSEAVCMNLSEIRSMTIWKLTLSKLMNRQAELLTHSYLKAERSAEDF